MLEFFFQIKGCKLKGQETFLSMQNQERKKKPAKHEILPKSMVSVLQNVKVEGLIGKVRKP
jgi:hypothetical protein